METDILPQLELRLGRIHVHARQRLGIEHDHEEHVFGQGLSFFHLENWYSVHGMIRGALAVAGLLGRGRRNTERIRVVHNRVALVTLPPLFQGFTILQLSDMHAAMNPAVMARLIELLQDLTYDICVMTGDFRGRTYGPFEATLESVARVREHITTPVYGPLGNHDTIRMLPGLEAMGTASHISHNECSILLSHTPEVYRHAAHADIRLLLSGHTHGGQVCLPGSIPITLDAAVPRHMGAGPWRYHGLIGYTSVGVGSSIVPIRFNCPPEITLHHLECAGSGVPT
jgi:hypothetical protein